MNTASVNQTPNINIDTPHAKDSLKFVGIQKKFSIVDIIPSTDRINIDDDPQYSAQINDILATLKSLQLAKKSLSEVQSITKDIKSSYKTEKNDAWAPLDDSMLRQRYEATLQIKDILANAVYNHKNVFTADYSDKGIKLNLERKDLANLNLNDELSINIFSDNIAKLSSEIESNIRNLQDKIDKIDQSRWLSMEQLRNVQLEQKSVNDSIKATSATPSLASALAEVNKQNQDSASVNTLNNNNTTGNEANNGVVGIAKKNTPNDIDNAISPINAIKNNQDNKNQNFNTKDSNLAENSTQIPDDMQQNDVENNTTTNTVTATDATKDTKVNGTESTETISTNNQNIQADSQTAHTTKDIQSPSDSETNNISNAEDNTTRETNEQKVVGVVSGDEKEQVVDLFV
ncbi:hypothetical protein CQA53_01400 [Helicobacter didelphidarum]|uniref:Uncharacterized protein n=1 Tax=Helicobacter didelphidarum TaxID=2040648 RepID=A0A3D8IR44_9HELI|nr:hypothetical protein [Helicobacter didelphidarum]RDU67682.1 hypothetical protein CQA53_01400 [Helicobacter didelphidarum]